MHFKHLRLKLLTLIFSSSLALAACTHTPPIELDAVLLQNHLTQISDITLAQGNRTIGSPASQNTIAYLETELQKAGLTTQRESYTDERGNLGTNLIAELLGKSTDVLMLGAHHDSVEFGPGMNDNASGVVALLSIAQALTNQKQAPLKTIRFVFWDGEETGLTGSNYYFNSLDDQQLATIKNYLNVDTIGTLGGELYILDAAKNSLPQQKEALIAITGDPALVNEMFTFHDSLVFKPESIMMQQYLAEQAKARGFEVKEELTLSLNTDVMPFLQATPTAGIGLMNESLEDDGTLLYTPCYHRSCDTLDNIDMATMENVTHMVYDFVKKFAY